MEKISDKSPAYSGSNFFSNHVNKQQCIFFLLWVERQLLQIYKSASKVKRKGLPKTGPRPMVRDKQILALAKILKKFKLKDFAQEYGLSYGLVRLWNREPRVEEKAWEYQSQFAKAYLQELEKHYFAPKLNFTKYKIKTIRKAQDKIDWFLWEFSNYDPAIQWVIYEMVEQKVKLAQDNEAANWKLLLYCMLKAVDERDIYNPPRDKKRKDLFELQIKRDGELSLNIMKPLFLDLKKMIKTGDTKSTLRFVDWLEDSILNTIKYKTDLKISVINKGKKKRIEKKR